MLPEIRRTDALDSRRGRTRKYLLRLCLLIVVFLIAKDCVDLATRPKDPSGGRYGETWKTDSYPLRSRLRAVAPMVAETVSAMPSPRLALFQALHDRLNENPDIPELAENLRVLIGGTASPLRGADSAAGVFSDFHQILQRGIQTAAEEREYGKALKFFAVLCAHTRMMLNSDAADVLYLAVCADSARKLGAHHLPAARRKEFRSVLELFLAEPFPSENVFRCALMNSLRDYEKIRLNGYRFFLREPMPGTLFKEAFSGRGSLFRPIRMLVRDFFYPVDADEAEALDLYLSLFSGRGLPATEPLHAVARRERARLAELLFLREEALAQMQELAERAQ